MKEKQDIRIKTDYYNFHLRVVAVIARGNKYLIQQIEGYDYYILPGGHTELGENSVNAIKREVKEELNCNVKECNLFCLHENFYLKKGKTEHWVEMYFKIETEEKLPDKEWTITEEDKDDTKILHYKWVTSKELEGVDLKPTSIKKLMVDNKIDEFNYIIDEVK